MNIYEVKYKDDGHTDLVAFLEKEEAKEYEKIEGYDNKEYDDFVKKHTNGMFKDSDIDRYLSEEDLPKGAGAGCEYTDDDGRVFQLTNLVY